MNILYYASKFNGCGLAFNQVFNAVYNPSIYLFIYLFKHEKLWRKKIQEKFKNYSGIIWSHEVHFRFYCGVTAKFCT